MNQKIKAKMILQKDQPNLEILSCTDPESKRLKLLKSKIQEVYYYQPFRNVCMVTY